ncbi:pseudouridine synthase [Testicularia cyperi]|uniref:Pseudouridine synthase n=1 Tax=Testicularia cyperi TaxID=1882483 RepID=A0A317XJT9_9BASI|nr:pseudouridine synthase [Testicularia cyperi]
MEARERYRDWSKEGLMGRIAELEAQMQAARARQSGHSPSLATQGFESSSASGSTDSASTMTTTTTTRTAKAKKVKPPKPFDFASTGCRKVAFRFSYDGAGYSGLAAQNVPSGGAGMAAGGTPLPTVEGVLWDALCTARLVDPALGMEGAGFSRCGRTDRGVSAAGQVVALWVRSRKLDHWAQRRAEVARQAVSHTTATATEAQQSSPPPPSTSGPKLEADELPYVQILNRILPISIRIQAWSPVRPDFSARFDCAYRHYKYFFNAGPPGVFFPPPLAETGSGGVESSAAALAGDSSATRLDVEAMSEAAAKLLGEHDFRNLCKIDASKQITNFRRRIDGVSIDPVRGGWPTRSAEGDKRVAGGENDEPMYVLNLRGTAFLYHQVRNIMAILFLVGARLESASIVDELMNVHEGAIAADRVKMRTAALEGTADGATANLTDKDGKIKWWMPVNGTCSTITDAAVEHERENPEDLGVPMWLSEAFQATLGPAEGSGPDLEIYETKPNYEMAADRPLVLWECGFLASDVEWRVGSYDGPLATMTAQDHVENSKTASSNLLRIHKAWTQARISEEITRHFVLASPSPGDGTLPSRTRFERAAFPKTLEGSDNDKGKAKRSLRSSGVIPLGNGTGRGAATYPRLSGRAREDTFQLKNQRWLETTGKRRAERKATEQTNSQSTTPAT